MEQTNQLMKYSFRTMAALAVSLMASSLVPALKADELDKKTNITIDQAIKVQGIVLLPGSYVLTILGPSPNRYAVQIFSADEKQYIATILATPAYWFSAAPDSEFKFYDAVAGQPPALHTWFYPGEQLRL